MLMLSTWRIYSPPPPVMTGYGGASRFKELIIKVLCPANKIGRVIGKGGSSIKSIRQETGARIEVDDPKRNHSHSECVVTVIASESSEDLKSMAVEAVLLLQGKINSDDDDTVTMRLLVPSKVIGCIIGKVVLSSMTFVKELKQIYEFLKVRSLNMLMEMTNLLRFLDKLVI